MEFLLKLVGGIEQRSLASCFMTNRRKTVVGRQRAMLYPPMSQIRGKKWKQLSSVELTLLSYSL